MPKWKLDGTLVVEDKDATSPDPASGEVVDAAFDPADHTIDDVKAYVEANPDAIEAIADAEADGKDRTTLMNWLLDRLDERDAETDSETDDDGED